MKKSEPNIVYFYLRIQGTQGKRHEFEINFDTLSCQRRYLDEQKKLYVICQTYSKDGTKTLVIRSPIQVTNNL